MQNAWDRTSSVDSDKPGYTKMLGKGQSSGYPPKTASDTLQSITVAPLDSADNKGLQVGVQLPGSSQTGPQHQNQQLVLTPASLQLAQLQAQLTLHRLKLAQEGNTAAAAASVLNQVLSNVNMSQPLFNQLRTSAMVGSQQSAFPTGVLGFSSSNSPLGALVGGGFNQNPGNVRLNHPCGGGTMGQQGAEYGKKCGPSYPSDTDRRLQYNLVGGTSAALATSGDGPSTVMNAQAKNITSVGLQRDFFGQDIQVQQAGFSEQKMNAFNSMGRKEQWKGHANLSQTGKVDVVSNPPSAWTAAGQPVQPRIELYNPEEPTPDPKLNCGSAAVSSFDSSGMQGLGVYHRLHGKEETSGTRTLQPYQVNDYHAVTPTQLPHQCSICDKKVYNLKDWDQHVKGKLHLQNRMLYANESSAVVSTGAIHYAIGRPSDGGLNPGGTSPIVCPAASQDVSSGANMSYLPATAMKTYPMSDTGFASNQPESKPFPIRKASVGRVVHICNLPEGSCTENDVINLGLPFGKVTNYILMRSTHQAFLEMAYVEAAHAMVQYYQLTPAMINNQKLLIRMSKRYKELQLKKPGKDVQSIIQDITSQRERDDLQQPHEHYIPERARSRSPISHSLSPHSHSPSFTSCSSAHSPQGVPCRGPERGFDGLGPHRGSWEWSSHLRKGEDERERDNPWRNGSSVDDDRPNGRADRRKIYQKSLDHLSRRFADERGGGGGGEGMRGSRDWHPRGSPQGSSFNSYRNTEDDFYKEQVYKSDKPLRPPYQRHDTKSKRKDGGDYHTRSRHSESNMTDEPLCRTPENKRQSSPSGGRSNKTSRRYTAAEKKERENATENTDSHSKEKSGSPQQISKTKEASECGKDRDIEKDLESCDDTDEECWYPKNMEELVTVDEVGGEDDSIIEPDISELEELTSCPKDSTVEQTVEERKSPSTSSLEAQQTSNNKSKTEKSCEDAGDQAATTVAKKEENVSTSAKQEEQKTTPVTSELPVANLSEFPSEEFKAALEETRLEDSEVTNNGPPGRPMENHICVSEDSKTPEVGQVTEVVNNEVQHKDNIHMKDTEARSPSREQDRAVSEHSIALGVEFVVPRSGFYCKLCGLFYTSEETAKTTHCRSTVHYRNLQRYLSQLAEVSLSGVL